MADSKTKSDKKPTKAETKKAPAAPRKLTTAAALLKSMTARKAAQAALRKGAAPTLHVTFDEEGNEQKVVKEEKKSKANTKKAKSSKIPKETKKATADTEDESKGKKRKSADTSDNKDNKEDDGKQPKKRKQKGVKKAKQSKSEVEDSKAESKRSEAIDYLKQFHNDRTAWKFRKIQQVWLLQHMYNEEQMTDQEFDMLLEYLKDLQGSARAKTLEEAQKVFQEATGTSQNLTSYAQVDTVMDDDDDFDAEKLLAKASMAAPAASTAEAATTQEDCKTKRAKAIVRILA
ncbi:uncharacterized protein BYT42DRAFT_613708 [Radiomyces spectabilis]|uniref:uncharacterized protein n=1 Tax=Radiomyces spectabilis TaxID=64574 RepID=UPI00221E7470|nr:uncharacterized protein BYT42DRAFT_613708 [Radiomyces spectabilis]KAI8379395.1 hypothetical protein BYT42DRAFT_613708 [Radiomyces spectabilis]